MELAEITNVNSSVRRHRRWVHWASIAMRNRRLDVRLVRDGGKAVVTKIRRVVSMAEEEPSSDEDLHASWRCRVGVNGRGLDEDLHASTERHL